MARSCARTGCAQPGVVSFGFDARSQLVWFATADADEAGTVLCARHADSMVLPKGWWLDDRRVATPSLFRTRTAREADAATGQDTPAAPARGEGRPARRSTGRRRSRTAPPPEPPAASAADPELFEATDPPPAPAPDPSAAADPEPPPDPEPWVPVFDTNDDLDGLLDASTPLLGRAFGRRKPRQATRRRSEG